MITLITGTPGSSKTLNAIDLILNDPAFKDRDVYAYNLSGLTLDWDIIDEDQAKNWYNLPKGAVILLDECQDLFPPEKFGSKVPEHISKLNTHRHLGIDLVLITQHPKLIDTKVRRLVGQHFHFKRQFGLESATRFTFQQCADDPNDYHAQKAATKTRKRFNKKLYGVYKSAEVHTHKKKIPWLVWALLALIVVVVVTIYSVINNFGANDSADSPEVETSAPGLPSQTPASKPAPTSTEGQPMTREQYVKHWSPRLESVPHSAPAYDEVYEVRDFPRPQCIQSAKTDECSCYTQQATPLEVPESQCRDIVANGYWDPTRPPEGDNKAKGGAKGGNQGQQGTAHGRNMRALHIYAQMEELKW